MSATGKDRHSPAVTSARMWEQPVEAAQYLARSAWRLGVLPALALPQPLRAPLLDGLRWWVDGVAGALPRPWARATDGFAADLDDLEGRLARREDLGRRLLRERRRAARGG